MITHRDFIGHLLNEKNLLGEALEIGTYRGEWAEQLLIRWQGRLLHCVDPFINQPFEQYTDGTNKTDLPDAMGQWSQRLARFRARTNLILKFSDVAAADFASDTLDFIHVDGNHCEAAVTQDLNLFWPKLRRGGLFSGHDYYDCDSAEFKCGVKTAVDRFAREHDLPLLTTEPGWQGDVGSWYIWKP